MKCALACDQTSNANHCRELIWHTISKCKFVFSISILLVAVVLVAAIIRVKLSAKASYKTQNCLIFHFAAFDRNVESTGKKLKISVPFGTERQSTGRCSLLTNKRRGKKRTKMLVDMIVGCRFACHLLHMHCGFGFYARPHRSRGSEIRRWDPVWWFLVLYAHVVQQMHFANIKCHLSFNTLWR